MRRLTKRSKKPRKLRITEKENLWILQLIDNPEITADISYEADLLVAKAWGKGLCVVCKGSKFLCGKTRCPLVIRLKSYFQTVPLIQGMDMDGASPPGVFVGRIGYPYVYAGPLGSSGSRGYQHV